MLLSSRLTKFVALHLFCLDVNIVDKLHALVVCNQFSFFRLCNARKGIVRWIPNDYDNSSFVFDLLGCIELFLHLRECKLDVTAIAPTRECVC